MAAPKYPNRLAEARELAGMTQQQVADAVGLTITGYQNYEWGKRDIRSSSLRKLSAVLSVSSDFLLGLDVLQQPEQADSELTVIEQYLVDCYRAANEQGRSAIMAVAENQAGEKGAVPDSARRAG